MSPQDIIQYAKSSDIGEPSEYDRKEIERLIKYFDDSLAAKDTEIARLRKALMGLLTDIDNGEGIAFTSIETATEAIADGKGA